MWTILVPSAWPLKGTIKVDWLQSLKHFVINVSFYILGASLTLMALKTRPSENRATRVRLAPSIWNDTLMKKNVLRTGASLRKRLSIQNIDQDITQVYRPPDKSAYVKIIFLISQPKHMLWVLKRTGSLRRFSTKTHVVGTQKNRLNEPVLLSTHNICLNWWIRKSTQFCLSIPMISAVSNVSRNRCESDYRSRDREFDPGPVRYFRGDWSWNNFMVILLPSAESFKKGCCELQGKVCARSTG